MNRNLLLPHAFVALITGVAMAAPEATRDTVTLLEAGQDHSVWQRVSRGIDDSGQPLVVTNTWTELCTSLNYWDPSARTWKRTVEAFEITPEGDALADQGPHRLAVAANVRSWGAVQLETPEGERFRTHLLGLAYFDPSSGRSVLIAEPKDSIGLLVNSNRVVWEDALTDLRVDVRVTYSRAGIEHDLVLLEAPPEPGEFDLPEGCLLEVWHEVVESPRSVTLGEIVSTNGPLAGIITSKVADGRVAIGSMSLGQGRAFALEPEGDGPGLPALREEGQRVRRGIHRIDGRLFLIESVEHAEVREELRSLPQAAAPNGAGVAVPSRGVLADRVQPNRMFPAPPPRPGQRAEIRLAKASALARALVLDYAVLGSSANQTLKSDVTYHVSGLANLTGVTTLEGTVIKFSPGAQIRVNGSLRCLTGPYNPAILTAYDDNTAGETLPGSTGNPWGAYYAANALYLEDRDSDLHHVRILHAQQGVYYDYDTGSPHVLSHAQFLHCQKAILPYGTTVQVRNALMQDVQTAFYNATYPATAIVEHLTATNVTTFRGSSLITLNVTNSLLVNVTTVGTISSGSCAINPSPSTVFASCGAGRYYLPLTSVYRNAGTPFISQTLKEQFAFMTTEAPTILTGSISSPTALAPSVWRDSDVPDLGWHYPAVDFLASNATLNATLTLKDGVAVGVTGSTGIQLAPGANLDSEGGATWLNRLFHFQAVQEQPQGWYVSSLLSASGAGQTIVRLRLTEICPRSGVGYGTFLSSSYAFQRLSLVDCQLHRSWINLSPAPSAGVNPIIGLTNNLFDRCQVSLYHTAGSLNTPTTARLFNNLFTGGQLVLAYDVGSSNPTWEVRDNLFDGATQSVSGGGQATYIQRSHNAFTTGTANSLGGSPAYTGLNRDFQPGPLGEFYLPPVAATPSLGYLVGRGSRTDGGTVGLFHHTTQVNQEKEQHSAVDVGFHYLAVDPAQTEIAKSGITATASTSTTGWDPAKAKDQLTTDPGWHNNSYTGTSEYLRLDLGTSRTVSRLGYLPRQMSGNWTDGTHNGVIRKYEVYVTDNASGTPANWGAPVATGEWYWPNRQERREASFAPATGRYVYLRRVNAWGWYGPQDPNYAQYGYPGFANANEIWVYESKSAVSTAIDTDFEGLPDYIEDANGNGTVDAGETSANAEDTDTDGLSDACERIVTGTNPTDPDSDHDGTLDGEEASLEQVTITYSFAHAKGIEADSTNNDQTKHVERLGMIIPKGTDVLRISVFASTTEDHEYEFYNDQLTYLIRSPLIGIYQGTVGIAEIGDDQARYIIQPKVMVCHNRTLNSASYVELEATALNVNWPGSRSMITVDCGALRVDLTTPGLPPDNRYVFDDSQPVGMLSVPFVATVQGNDTGLLAEGDVRFEIDPIGEEQPQWQYGSDGIGQAGPGSFENTAWFLRLPADNADFGPRQVRLYVDGFWGLDDLKNVSVFYSADAANHPDDGTLGADRGTYCGSNEAVSPNWYYYWNKTAAASGSPEFCANAWCMGLSHTVCESAPNPPWVAHVHYDARTLEAVPGSIPVGWPEELKIRRVGIDYFAFVCRHEGKHVTCYSAWGATHQPDREHVNVPNDYDDDDLPDILEEPPDYAVNRKDANSDGVDDGHEYIFRNQELPTRHAYDTEDWSNIGCNYVGNHYFGN